jgi:hypothetical protein
MQGKEILLKALAQAIPVKGVWKGMMDAISQLW